METHPMYRILLAASEAAPLIKTGGLGDVCGALPGQLRALGHDCRLLLPAYPAALAACRELQVVARFALHDLPEPAELLEGIDGDGNPAWLLNAPSLFARDGNPYTGPDGHDWPDNARRFGLFSRAVAQIAAGAVGLDWRADVVHCNDWQTGLVPLLLHDYGHHRPASLFTIHNLAYRGLFPVEALDQLGLSRSLFQMHGLEFYGQIAFIKGGLLYADWLTTVSPTYAREIRSEAHGQGLHGLLETRSDRLVGILNGADYRIWNPASDPHLAEPYDRDSLARKAANKAALQREMGLQDDPRAPLCGLVSRLVEQKGIDLVLTNLDWLVAQGAQLALLGSGQREHETALLAAAERHPGRIAVRIGYNDPLAHRIEAGADLFLMPSRFEPCGLNQIYSLRYGTPPLVRRTGGLADTVVETNEATLQAGTATGFVFDQADAEALRTALAEAMRLYRDQPHDWHSIQATGMAQDFGWERSARAYEALYRRAINRI